MNEQQSQSRSAGAPASRPPRRRRLLWVLAAVVVAVAALAAAAPTLLSTPPIRDAALGWYNRAIAGEVRVREMSLSWLGGQSIRGLAVNDARGNTVLQLGELTTDLTLLDALRGRLSLGRTVASALNVDLRFAEDGSNNLAAALAGEPSQQAEAGGGFAVPVTGNMALVNGRVSISAPGVDPIVLDGLGGEVSTAERGGPIHVSFSGQSRQGDLQGSIELTGRINDLFSDGQLTPAAATANVDAGIEDLPVDALDRLLGLRGVLSEALGDRTSLTVKADGSADRQEVSIDAEAPRARLQVEGTVAEQRFRLRSPATARLELTPALVDAAMARESAASGPRLAGPVPLALRIERLDIPLENFSLARVALESTLSSGGAVRLAGIEKIGEMDLQDLRLQISSPGLAERVQATLTGQPVTPDGTGELALEADVQRLIDEAGNLQLASAVVEARSSITGIPTSLVDAALQQDGLLVDAAGDRLDLKLDAGTDADGRIQVSANLDADRVHTGAIQFVIDDRLTLAQPAQIRLTVAPALWRRLVGDSGDYQLTEAAELTVDLDALDLPLPAAGTPGFQPAATRLVAALSATSMSLAGPDAGPATRIHELQIELDAGDGLDALSFRGDARLQQPGGTLESLAASPLRVALEGETGVNDDTSIRPVRSSLQLSSEGLNAEAATVIEQDLARLALAEPASFDLALTPALAARWQDSAAPAVTLRGNGRLEGSVTRLVVPLAPFDSAGLEAVGEASLSGSGPEGVVIESPGGSVTRLQGMSASFELTGADGGRGRVALDGQIGAPGGEPGDISVEASASGLLDGGGALAPQAMSLELDGAAGRLPVALVDQLLDLGGTASATLGPTTDLVLSAQLERMRGPLSVTLDAPHASAAIQARLGDKGLTLSEPLDAQVEPTPEFGSQVLAKVHPIFETTQRAEQPIRFQVPPDGVLIPVDDFDFSRVTVPEMTLDFGRIVLKSGWLLRGVIGLSRQFGKLESVDKDEWVAWFTPGVMAIRDGRVLYTRRLDMLLAEKLHLATWGSADVSRDRSDLTLAFMPDTMERVFSITVAGDDALHVPVTGPLSSPSINFKKAGADLARLRAQEEVSGDNPLAGALLGAVTGRATGSGQGPVPPPSVTPLPWAEQLEALDAAESQPQQSGAQQQPSQQEQQADQPAPDRKPSTEEQVIRGLIDMFGKQKKE